jgi:hypothetical protein
LFCHPFLEELYLLHHLFPCLPSFATSWPSYLEHLLHLHPHPCQVAYPYLVAFQAFLLHLHLPFHPSSITSFTTFLLLLLEDHLFHLHLRLPFHPSSTTSFVTYLHHLILPSLIEPFSSCYPYQAFHLFHLLIIILPFLQHFPFLPST